MKKHFKYYTSVSMLRSPQTIPSKYVVIYFPACRVMLPQTPTHTRLPQGSRFFWRSKETIDVAYHYNSDEGLITISTRCPERAYNYPAIFVDVAKIPVHKSEAVSRRSFEWVHIPHAKNYLFIHDYHIASVIPKTIPLPLQPIQIYEARHRHKELSLYDPTVQTYFRWEFPSLVFSKPK